MTNDKEKANTAKNAPVIVPETEESTGSANKDGRKNRKTEKNWLIILIALLALIGLGVGIYFLVKKPAGTAEDDDIEEIEEIEELTDEERYAKIDEEIANSTEDTYIPLVLEKANRETGLGLYDKALATLSTIAESDLDTTLLFNYYSSYVSLFTAQGAEKETEEYQAKADAIYQKLIAEGVIPAPEEEEETENNTEATE